MKETTLTIPEVTMIAGTRVELGAGIGFPLADKLSSERRRATGIVLLPVGAISTITLALEVLGKSER